ncbi:MAG: PAS domain S-box protein [Deltaproteobacteria bacterium]|nr:PAS domain S-box protein [Deltaproteobacteria bacterium]
MDHQELRTTLGPLLFSALPDPVFVVSPDGVFLDVNPAAARYFRRPPAEVVGRSVRELFPPDQVERQLSVLQHVLETGETFLEERPIAFGEDHYLFRYTVEVLRDSSGTVLGVLGMVRDMTAFVALERKYAALYEGATDALFAIDDRGGLRALNREAEVMSGYSREQLEQLKIWDVIDPAEVPRLQEYLRARAAGEDAPTQYENRWIHGSGEPRWADVRISREPIEPGVFQASVRDITERRRLEELRRDFVHMISHDVKAPLTVAQGYTQTLLAGRWGELTPPQADALTQIGDATRRIGRMMSQFLMAEGLDAADAWDRKPGSVASLAEGVVQAFRGDAEAAGIELIAQIYLPIEVLVADREATHRILDNLVSNALKFTPRGGRVCVGVQPAARGVSLTVEDTGDGIPAAEMDRVFERFFRASTALNHRGSGLGLYIVRRLAERCGGQVSVSSPPGVGCRFEAWLPVARGAGKERGRR